ncbi:MAG: ribosomal protein S18-alanine N-acetyltransferase [Deltaproteobacteria bacterium]|nr:ribosomal protein S18-alanine N-acetyltransferase [Deltaproteobacteria bacterium]
MTSHCELQIPDIIIQANLQHLDAIFAIENECFSHPWDRASLQNELEELSWSRTYISLCNDTPVGYISFWSIADEYQILKVAVRPPFRQQRIGKRLLDHIIQLGRLEHKAVITLELRESNAGARALYEKSGFLVSGLRKRYYSDTGENAIVMNYYFQ